MKVTLLRKIEKKKTQHLAGFKPMTCYEAWAPPLCYNHCIT